MGSAASVSQRYIDVLQRVILGADMSLIVFVVERQDPEVAELLTDEGLRRVARKFQAPIKGFEEESFRLWSVSARSRQINPGPVPWNAVP